MIRLYTPAPDDDFDRSTRELADYYSRPQQPRREHPDSIGAPAPNRRNGALTGTEYELVELACTMPARHALANLHLRAGFPAWQETAPLPALAFGPQPEDPTPAEWLTVDPWEEATAEEMSNRATLGMTLLLMVFSFAALIYLQTRV